MAQPPSPRPPLTRLLLRLCVTLAGVAYAATAAPAQQSPRFINPSGLVKPAGYTHVVLSRDGRTAYIAGQVALDSAGRVAGTDDFPAQAEQVFANLSRALASVGGSFADLVKTTTYVTDVKYLPALRAARERFLDAAHPPANTLIVVDGLARPGLLLEIEAVAELARPAGP